MASAKNVATTLRVSPRIAVCTTRRAIRDRKAATTAVAPTEAVAGRHSICGSQSSRRGVIRVTAADVLRVTVAGVRRALVVVERPVLAEVARLALAAEDIRLPADTVVAGPRMAAAVRTLAEGTVTGKRNCGRLGGASA
jgi:hypothetical protein